MAEYQTLAQFINAPFGTTNVKKSTDYETEYKSVKTRLRITGYCEMDESYLIHVTVPSKSNKSQIYDVVILFFTDDPSVKKQRMLNNYYIKFYSNSPSFIYKYAALYKKNGYLIDAFFDKMDAKYSDIMPDKTNKGYEMFYDKSIYCACRYLLDSKTALSKFGILLHHKQPQTAFFRSIKDFEDTKFSGDSKSVEKKIEKELDALEKEGKSKKKRTNRPGVKPKKTAVKATGTSSINRAKRIAPASKKGKVKSKKTTMKK